MCHVLTANCELNYWTDSRRSRTNDARPLYIWKLNWFTYEILTYDRNSYSSLWFRWKLLTQTLVRESRRRAIIKPMRLFDFFFFLIFSRILYSVLRHASMQIVYRAIEIKVINNWFGLYSCAVCIRKVSVFVFVFFLSSVQKRRTHKSILYAKCTHTHPANAQNLSH